VRRLPTLLLSTRPTTLHSQILFWNEGRGLEGVEQSRSHPVWASRCQAGSGLAEVPGLVQLLGGRLTIHQQFPHHPGVVEVTNEDNAATIGNRLPGELGIAPQLLRSEPTLRLRIARCTRPVCDFGHRLAVSVGQIGGCHSSPLLACGKVQRLDKALLLPARLCVRSIRTRFRLVLRGLWRDGDQRAFRMLKLGRCLGALVMFLQFTPEMSSTSPKATEKSSQTSEPPELWLNVSGV